MYIRATDFLSLKSKISESVHGKKMSGSSSIKTTNSDINEYRRFTAKITFFSGLRFFN